ncbi:MAG: type II toxin-antitoxin system VapC family toxin [Gemmataceae bacterium]|nr:type II toxin-antitoxin system VapC family toxin [Gemmataceae bacterium]
MTPGPGPYQLDTNVLVHYVRRSGLWERVRASYNLLMVEPTPIISVVTEGELRSLALQFKWGPRKLDRMEYALSFFPRKGIDSPRVIEAYARIDADMIAVGRRLGKNDLWIAATASVYGVRLLTTDTDFDDLAPDYLALDWIDPGPPPG